MATEDSTSESPSPSPSPTNGGVQARATALLGRPKLWLLPTVLTGLLALLLSLLYMGGIVSPNRDLHDLPIGIVNADRGAPLPGQKENLGAQIVQAITTDTSGGDKAEWRELSLSRAQDELDSGKLYGALVVPDGFTASVAALTGTSATARPALTVLTNPGKGSLGSSLASQITTQAAHQASQTIGEQLTASAKGASATTKLLLADPVAVTPRSAIPSAPTAAWASAPSTTRCCSCWPGSSAPTSSATGWTPLSATPTTRSAPGTRAAPPCRSPAPRRCC